MFFKKTASSEIAESMESSLITHAIEKKEEHINKFAEALDRLNRVAEIFDDLGLRNEAEATTRFIEVIAAKKSKKKPVKSKRKSKKPSKSQSNEKMVENLKEKGWLFDIDDHHDIEHSIDNDDEEDNHHDYCDCSMCMDADDFNYDFLNIDDDFEDEIEFPHKHHKAIFPPPGENLEDMPDLRPFKPSTKTWGEIGEYTGNKETVRPGKYHHKPRY